MACYILNLGFAYESLVHMDFNQIDATCIRANHSIFEMSSSCIILLHMIVYWLPAPFLLDRSCSGDVPEYLSVKQCLPCCVTRQANPLEHVDKSHSLAPAPFTVLGQQRFKTATFCCGSWNHSSAWPVIAIVNSWNPLAWVGVAWALMCLLIHACFSLCQLCLELCQV